MRKIMLLTVAMAFATLTVNAQNEKKDCCKENVECKKDCKDKQNGAAAQNSCDNNCSKAEAKKGENKDGKQCDKDGKANDCCQKSAECKDGKSNGGCQKNCECKDGKANSDCCKKNAECAKNSNCCEKDSKNTSTKSQKKSSKKSSKKKKSSNSTKKNTKTSSKSK